MSRSENKENIFVRIAKYLFPWKGDRVSEIIRKIIFVTAAVVLIVTGSVLLTDKLQRMNTNKKDEDRANQFHLIADNASNSSPNSSNSQNGQSSASDPSGGTSAPQEPVHREVLEQFKPLLEQNPETIGWLTIPSKNDTNPWIDYVVMQTDNNDKYLAQDFNGNKRKSGALFVDYADKITPEGEPANIVIYGHNMASGEYFGRLINYFNYGRSNGDPKNINFYKNHPTVEFSTLYKSSTYKIFAAIMLNTEEEAGEVFNYYLKHNFKNQSDFNEYCAEILDRSTFYNPDVNVKYGDNLLTLSTCMFGYGDTELRFVVFARETREGESPEVDVNKAYANPNPKFYDLYYKLYNYTWNGRKWDKNLLVGYDD